MKDGLTFLTFVIERSGVKPVMAMGGIYLISQMSDVMGLYRLISIVVVLVAFFFFRHLEIKSKRGGREIK